MVHGPPPSRARLRAAAAPIAARRGVLVFSSHRSLMSIHTEKPNPRLSTKPVTTPENATSFFVARRVDGVRFSDRRVSQASQRWRGALPQRFRVVGAEVVPQRRHGRNKPMAKGLEVAVTRTPRTNRRTVYILSIRVYFYALRAAIADAPTAWSVSRAFRSSSPCASMRSSVCCVCSLKASWI